MIYWENTKIIKSKKCALFECDICKENKYLSIQDLKNKKFPYCFNCYQKTSERKQASLECVKNRKDCNGKNNKRYSKIEKTCYCGKTFDVPQYRKNIALFCSRKCQFPKQGYSCEICNEWTPMKKSAILKRKNLLCTDCYYDPKNSDLLKRATYPKGVTRNRGPHFDIHCPCGKTFEVSEYYKDTTKYCSRLCAGKYGEAVKEHLRKLSKTRDISGKNNPAYSSIELICKCGLKFITQPFRIKACKNTYCSRKCANKYTIQKYYKVYYNDIGMRSSWEIKFAQYLDSKNIKWIYEPESFETPFGWYTPDFYVEEWGVHIEVKGYFRDQNARDKFYFFQNKYGCILADKEYFKELGFKLVNSKWT